MYIRQFSLAAIAMAAVIFNSNSPATSLPASPNLTPFHCQVPCGIYGDKMRIDMLMEQSATVNKAMVMLEQADQDAAIGRNQTVRWVMTKEEHAASIQEMVASYWLAQRIKHPQDSSDAKAMAHYHKQLELLHGITVAAMKCKQTVETSHVDQVRKLTREFSATYFSKEDQAHLNEHTFEK